ncbi:DNA mismatch repair endonuclease MutL [Membranicola marinus]|uniref:DNA mismatch repair protein MutL n=1 Tax=Membranihabitans marinus TaxID=1227546 RepID=A0A953L917_9BACT|nr:DNA mismatch repair endonuclease MutL [Membranihabitans marinus]MBY5957163.1 DNA mismatch repair endonuclease MutL [Membranihabitans marinus]
MKGNIKMLPDVVANQIAAGEVVVRPASAVKELMENSIDALATKIEVIIQDSGKTKIQVIDNGSGMSEMDARMCLERHATSKISTNEDLQKLFSLGFRGEALPSIASVSQLELKTRQEGEEMGLRLEVHGSEVIKQEYCQAEIGTSITISNLFYNTPARRKFLKSDTVEFKHILDVFQNLALAYPDIHLTLYHNDRLYHQLYPGNLKQRIVQIFGNPYEHRLIHVKEDTDYLKITGFVGKPENAKKSRGEQYLYINNRYIKNFRLTLAVYQAYEKLIDDNSYPFFCLFLQMDPEKMDVNVHPTKQEIKLEDENFVFNIMQSAVKHALMQYSVPTIDFDQDPTFIRQPKPDSLTERPSASSSSSGGWDADDLRPHKKWTTESWDDFYDNVKKSGEELEKKEQSEFAPPMNFIHGQAEDVFVPIQIKNSYIISSIKSGIVIIDQKNAHQRILYERFLEQNEKQNLHGQSILFPEVLHLSPSEALAMEKIRPIISGYGFVIEPFGKNAYVLQAMPDILLLDTREKLGIIHQVLDEFQEERKLGPTLHETIAALLAKNMSIKRNRKLSSEEIKELVHQLFACKEPSVSPSGKKCFVTFKSEDLEKLFTQ